MTQSKSARRQLLRAGVGFACAAVVARPVFAQAPVPFSRGTEAPRLKAAPLACDSHFHIMDTRFPASPHWKGQPVEDATVEAYRQPANRAGTPLRVFGIPPPNSSANP